MKKRIFHKILIPALVVMLMTPFCFSVVKADATNQQILDMLTSIRSQVVYILQTQRIGSSGNYDTIDYLQKMDTNLLELDTHLTEIMADMTAAWDQTDPLQTDNYFESILNYFNAFYDGIGSSATHLSYIRGNTSSMLTTLTSVKNDLDHISAKIDELVTLVSNIDNTVDTISWVTKATIKGFTTDFTNFTTTNGLYGAGYILYNDIDWYVEDYMGDPIIKMDFVCNGVGIDFLSHIKPVIVSTANTVYDLSPYVVYSTSNRGNLTYYIMLNSNTGNYSDLQLNLSGHYYFGFYKDSEERRLYFNVDTNKMSCIYDNDIEYWSLFNTFVQFKNWNISLNNQSTIINKMDTLIDGNNSSNSVVNQNNNLNQQLQTSVTQYDQVENQFKESFSTSMNQISKPDLSNIVSAAAWYTTQLTSLFNASGSFQIIYVLPLVLGIALFFIGRGAVAFRQSSNQETRWVETVKDENGFTTRHGTIRSETVRGKGRYK